MERWGGGGRTAAPPARGGWGRIEADVLVVKGGLLLVCGLYLLCPAESYGNFENAESFLGFVARVIKGSRQVTNIRWILSFFSTNFVPCGGQEANGRHFGG